MRNVRMRKTHLFMVTLVSTLMLSACGVPLGPIPGGKLEGTLTEWPENWDFTQDIENILLETRPDDPYSVTLWGVSYDGKFYVGASSRKNRWVDNIAANSEVLLDVNGAIYEARATVVTNSDEIDAVLQGYIEKYEVDDPSDFTTADGILFRLSPR